MYIYVHDKSHVVYGVECDIDLRCVWIVDSEWGIVVDVSGFRRNTWALEGGCLQGPTIGNSIIIELVGMYVVVVVNVVEVEFYVVGMEWVSSVVRINGASITDVVS